MQGGTPAGRVLSPLSPISPIISTSSPTMIPDAQILTQCYYTTPRGHSLLLDVILPPSLIGLGQTPSPSPSPKRYVPVIIAFHGGGILNGCRREQYIYQPVLGGC
jgi:hypothetical protein